MNIGQRTCGLGRRGWALKDVVDEEQSKCLKNSMEDLEPPAGERLQPPPAGRKTRRWLRDRLSELSPRERDVLAMALMGQSCKTIALALDLSEHTVGDYLKQLHRHFEMNSRPELMARFISEKQIESVKHSNGEMK